MNSSRFSHRPERGTIKRVALLFEYPTLNGGERSMLAVVDRLQGRGFDFAALAPPEGRLAEALRRRGIAHVPLRLCDEGGRRLPREEACRRLTDAVAKVSPDLLHANSLSMGRLTGAAAEGLGLPTAVHLRDILKLTGRTVAELNRNTRLVAVSRATRDFHVAQGLDAARTRIIYNGVDCERFHPRPASGALRRELGLPRDAFLIVTIGQIGLRKGQDVLAEAAARAKHRLPRAHFLLVGERNSGKRESVEFEANVLRRFEEAGLAGRLHRLGYRDDVPRIMNEADLLAHPAHQEPLGRVLLEAAASGLPMVATDVGGTREIVGEGEAARLVPPGDPDALAEALAALYGEPAGRRRLAETARRRAERRFDIARAADELARLWERLRASGAAE